MKIYIPYKIGEEVYLVGRHYVPVFPCHPCNNKGQLVIFPPKAPHEANIICPYCGKNIIIDNTGNSVIFFIEFKSLRI